MPVDCMWNDPTDYFSVEAWRKHLEFLRDLPEGSDGKELFIRLAEQHIKRLEKWQEERALETAAKKAA